MRENDVSNTTVVSLRKYDGNIEANKRKRSFARMCVCVCVCVCVGGGCINVNATELRTDMLLLLTTLSGLFQETTVANMARLRCFIPF